MSRVFNNLAQRVLYGHLLTLSDAPAGYPEATLHAVFDNMWRALYDDPALLGLPEYADESTPWGMLNNQHKELDDKYKAVFKGIYEFWKFLQAMALTGAPVDGALFAEKDALKAEKAVFKPAFAPLLEKGGFSARKDRVGVTLSHPDNGVLGALGTLAKTAQERASGEKLIWYVKSRALNDFMRCSFDGGWEYIIDRIDDAQQMGGALRALRTECVSRGYELRMHAECGAACTSGFGIDFMRGVGGFHITYNPRKTEMFAFGTKNGIGEKKMLENFSSLEPDMQRYFVDICRECTGCMGCTKGGKSKPYTVNVVFEGTEHPLCPMFPRHEWDNLTPERSDVLFMYHELQEKYGKRGTVNL